MRPLNLALRFALELAALAAFAAYGLHAVHGPARLVVAAALVLAAAAVWGRWAAPASRHRLADPARLAVEVGFFTAAGVALAATDRWLLGAGLTAAAVANAGLLRLLHRNQSIQRQEDHMRVKEGIHRLTQGVVNFYLIEDGGKLLLVDAGAPGDWDLLVRALADLGRRLDDLEAVLLTHAHPDHIGTAERARASAQARVWVHQADAAMATSGRPAKADGRARSYLLRTEFYRTLFSLARRGATRIVPVKEVATFADGETLELPGRPRAVHAPGHSPGSAALLLEGRRVLLTGDVLATRNPLTGRVGPQIMPSGLNSDTPQALRSLAALDGVPADVLLPGHGEPWTEGAAEAVRLARAAGPS